MSVPANGSTIKHTPSDGTKPYNGTVTNGALVITYVHNFDGEVSAAVREYDGSGDPWWFRTTAGGGVWRRRYIESSPPTVPPSGTYTVDEHTTEPDAWTQRESGNWSA